MVTTTRALHGPAKAVMMARSSASFAGWPGGVVTANTLMAMGAYLAMHVRQLLSRVLLLRMSCNLSTGAACGQFHPYQGRHDLDLHCHVAGWHGRTAWRLLLVTGLCQCW
jgi:hypothetical protein